MSLLMMILALSLEGEQPEAHNITIDPNRGKVNFMVFKDKKRKAAMC